MMYINAFSNKKSYNTAKPETKSYSWSCTLIKFWAAVTALGIVVYLGDYWQIKSLSFPNLAMFRHLSQPLRPVLSNSLEGYLINTPGCRIPDMKPYDPSIKDFIFKAKKIECKKRPPPLFASNLTTLYLRRDFLSHYNVEHYLELFCCYEEFKRSEPSKSQRDNLIVYSGNCTQIYLAAKMNKEEFLKVTCQNFDGAIVYEDYFSFVPVKRKAAMRRKTGKPSVLIIGLDGVSRMNLQRQLPKTYALLTNELKGFELFGYNKVADNTFPNLVPMLTGLFERELEKTCNPRFQTHFDDCPFVWKKYGMMNYSTAIGEDCAWISLFNYQKMGFRKQPVDYYYNTATGEMESKIGYFKDNNCPHCVGGREAYKITLDYIQKFSERMAAESTPYFGFFWGNSLSHDHLNRPSLGDDAYFNLFSRLQTDGLLKDTVLIFMSDHGIRWGDIRQTRQGQLEERLPFVIILLPKWFKSQYPKAVLNLNKNVRRLTTPFDLYETFRHLLTLNSRQTLQDTLGIARGYSLFNEVPKNRTCQSAEIDKHWCACQQSVPISVQDPEVISATNFAVYYINKQLRGYADCATLNASDILNARLLTYDKKHIMDNNASRDYTIIFRTKPGNAVFEVTVRIKYEDNQLATDQEKWNRFAITGTISRLNMYGSQSYCVTDFHLKLYCYCRHLLNR